MVDMMTDSRVFLLSNSVSALSRQKLEFVSKLSEKAEVWCSCEILIRALRHTPLGLDQD